MRHYLREGCNNFAALRIITAHAAEPQTILLSAVENRKLLFLDKFVAFGSTEAERVAIAFQREKQFRSIVVFPLARIHGATPQSDDDGQMFDPNGALKFARPAGRTLKCAL